MTEEAAAAPEPAASDAGGPPKPRRRRRGGRGRGGRGGSSSPKPQADGDGGSGETAGPSEAPSRARAPRTPTTGDGETTSDRETTRETTSDGGTGTGTTSSAARRRRRRRPASARPAGTGTSEAVETEADPASPKAEAGSAEETEAPEKPKPARRRPPAKPRAKPADADQEPGEEGDGDAPAPTRARTRRPAAKPAGEAAEATAAETTDGAAAETDAEGDGEAISSSAKRRRRRRRKKPAGTGTAEGGTETKRPSETKRPASKPEPAEKKLPPPTRTGRASRRRGTVVRRRRRDEEIIIPERRTDKTMLITQHGDRDQLVVIEGRELVEHYVTRSGQTSMVGNIYLGRVQNVLPGMEAAFVDVGRGRNAVLYAGEVSYDEEVDEGSRRIEQALKAGQSVLVQVTKDPMGGKGARLTGQVSVPGRYLVYVPDGGASGISRRLPEKERSRLRDVMKEIRPSGSGVIVRTAAEGASAEALAADLERLKKTWDSIKRKSRRAKPATVLYEEPELTVKVIRDVFSPAEFKEIVTDSKDVYERVTAYLKELAPDLLERVRYHEGPLSLMEDAHVVEQIHKALERKVWLPSGGYLIIDRTEAMTVIDVNTGKSVGKTNLEETVFGTNVEAAREIARQLRLRDIGGIIVIDFIDMLLQANRNVVIRTLKEEMAKDKTRSQVFDITPLGLLEVTRKRVSAGLVESFSETCPTCEGRGILITHEI